MTLVQFDKYTIDILERIALGIEEQNQRLENIEKILEETSVSMSCIEMMMENSENI